MAEAPAPAQTEARPTQDQARRAAELLSQLGPRANATSGLEALVRHAASFAGQGGLLDERTLALGLLASGLEAFYPRDDRPAADSNNAALWYVQWLADWMGATRIQRGLSIIRSSEGVENAQQSLSVSPELQGLFGRAVELAAATVRRDMFDLRHLVAAMALTGALQRQTNVAFGVELTAKDIGGFAQTFVSRIEASHERGEDPKAWREAFAPLLQAGPELSSAAPINPNVAADPSPQPPPAANTDRVTGFNPDRTDGATDPLDTEGDVEALAKLICLEEVTPLSVAVFGGWGAGKTTFMNRLDRQIREIADREPARRKAVAALNQGSRGYVRSVVPVWFNAWQFVDSNLWASLTAELFDQLRSGGREGAEADQHAELVEKVNEHVHALSDDAKAKREVAARSARSAEQARSARDDAARQLKTASDATIDQAALQALGEAYRAEKPRLDALGLSSAADSVATFLDVARDIYAGGKLKAIGSIIWRRRRLLFGLAVAALLALIAVGVAVWSGKLPPLASLVPALVAFAALVGSAAGAITPAARLVYSIASRGAQMVRKADAADADAASAFLKQEEHFREAAADARQRQAEADVAAKALSFYADPSAPSNPPRLLRYLLEDDPDTRTLEKEIGLIGRTRRLFQSLDYIMRHPEESAEGEDGDLDPDKAKPKRLQRIVIFIDDLDRCTEEQVYHALQATQLLLAFRSFVVVVGVDVDWVERTLASQIAGKAPAADPFNRQKAVDYLEKIFQVAFWLAPLSGPDGGGYGAFVHGLADPSPPPQPLSSQDQLGATAAFAGVDAPTETPDDVRANAAGADAPPDAAAGAQEPGAQIASQSEADGDGPATLEIAQLDQREADFLASDAIAGVAARTPRSVKRLVNVYRLVRARMERAGADLLGATPDYPLIAFFVALETGQPAAIANGVYQGLQAVQATQGDVWLSSLDLEGQRDDALDPLVAAKALGAALRECPAVGIALHEVILLRHGQLTANEALKVARIARRYSFNRFQ